MKEKILITGGAGYKGIVLAQRLLDQGFNVTVLDKFDSGFNSLLHLVQNDSFDAIKKDVRCIEEKDLVSYDVIYHLAAIVGYPQCEADPYNAISTNLEATQRLVSYLGREQLLVFASTTSFYGNKGLDCDENAPVEPLGIYGRTKYEAEQAVMQRENSIALRFATVFGVSPNMRHTLIINDFVLKALKERSLVLFNSGAKRSFIHIEDAAGAYVYAYLNKEIMKGQVYNIGCSSLNYSKKEIAEVIRSVIKVEIIESAIPDKDQRSYAIVFDKIANLGYKVNYTVEDGIRQLLKLYKLY